MLGYNCSFCGRYVDETEYRQYLEYRYSKGTFDDYDGFNNSGRCPNCWEDRWNPDRYNETMFG